MTLYEFSSLPQDQQLPAIWEHGTYLARCQEGDCVLILYLVNGSGPQSFYAEVWYHPASNQAIRHRVFKTDKLLMGYIPPNLLGELFG